MLATSYSKELRRDVLIALFVKALLIATLILGCKYLKQDVMDATTSSSQKTEMERYPIFNDTSMKDTH